MIKFFKSFTKSREYFAKFLSIYFDYRHREETMRNSVADRSSAICRKINAHRWVENEKKKLGGGALANMQDSLRPGQQHTDSTHKFRISLNRPCEKSERKKDEKKVQILWFFYSKTRNETHNLRWKFAARMNTSSWSLQLAERDSWGQNLFLFPKLLMIR